MNLDALFETYPFLRQMLEFLDNYAGVMLGVGFFVFMAYIFYWALVLLPRRVRQIYAILMKRGYRRVDSTDPDMLQVLSTLAPIYSRTPRKDSPIPEWEVQNACTLENMQETRYILDVSRMQVDRPGTADRRSRRESIMILEKKALNFSESIYMTPTSCSADWEPRFGLVQVQEGLDRELLEHYTVFTQSGMLEYFPATLRDVLLKVLQHFVAQDMKQAYYIPGLTLTFRKNGWGMCTGERLYTLEKMDLLIDVADMISRALGQEMIGTVTFYPQVEMQDSTEFREEASRESVFVLKPVFLPWVTLLSVLPKQIMMTLLGGGLLGIPGYFVVKELLLNVPGWFPFVFFGAIFFLLVPMMVYLQKKKKNERIEYRFYTRELEYYDGLSPEEKKTLLYTDLIGVTLRQGIFQKKHGVGTLVLLTLATGDSRKDIAGSGIHIVDIPNPNEVYTQIKERINSISGETPESKRFRGQASQKPLFVMKPVFLPGVTLLSAIPIQIGTTLLGGGLLGMLGALAVKVLHINVPEWFPAVFLGAILFCLVPIMAYVQKKKGYEHTEYRFYGTEFRWYSGWSTMEETTIHYTNISGVSLSKGILQKRYGLGTLFLLIQAIGETESDIARSRIKLADIPDPDEVYAQIKKLINHVS